nr:unnamed protein product [Callosobruchus analis]
MEQQGAILQRQRVTVSNKVRCFSKYLEKIKASMIDQNKQFSRAEIIALESRITEFQNLKAEFDTVQAEIEVLEDVDIEEQLVERENFDADFYMAIGGARSWLSFRDTFISLIHINNSLDNIQKFHFLRTSLVEDAGQVIADAEFSAEGYQVAWQLVNDRYNKVALLVNHNLKKLTSMPQMMRESSVDLTKLLDSIVKIMCSLKHLGINTENWDPNVIFLLTEKLDPRSRREWVSGLAVGNKEVKWRNKQKSVLATFQANSCCYYCKQGHQLERCSDFMKLKPYNRYQLENHNSKSCSSKGCKTCGSKHHSLLHFTKRSKPNDQGPTSSAPIATDAGQKDDEIQQIWGNDGKHHMCRILLDSGSQVNLISERLTKLLGSETSSVSTSIMGINQVVSSVQKRCVVKVGSLNSSFSKTLSCLIIPKIGDDIPNGIVKTSHLKIPDNLTLADRKFMEPGPIDLLVGAGEFYDFLCIGQYHLGQDQPVMQKTKVGWIVSGPVVVPQRSEMLRCHFVTNSDVAMDLENFWKIEEPNPSKDVSLSDEDIACERFFIETTTRDKDGKFVVKIPLCAPIEKLGDAKASALKKYLQLERRLEKNPMMKDRCIRQVGLDNLEGYPEAAACVIMNNFYVDDLVFSDDSSEKAVQVCREVDLVLKRYGFHLRKWISNIPEVVTKIGGDNSSEVIVDFGEKGTTKTLGLYWAVSKDIKAYGAAVYLRSVDASGSVQVSFVAAKSRVAPLKALTIPRLELCGALVLVELVQRIKGALTLKIDSIYLWCDSTVVLSWISTSPHLLQTFVSNRVAKIQELSQGDDWYHVKTDENPADLVSRGVSPGKLIHNELWFNGPSWLTREEDSWCKKDFSVLSDVPEMKKQCQVLHVAQSPRLIDFRRFSSFQKLVRSFAYCLRFSNNTRRKPKLVGHLTSSELESSLHSLLKLVQKETFSEGLRALEKGSPVKPARLLPLTPFMDPSGLLRVGGRLALSELSYESKHQILLPSKHWFVQLLFIHEHEKLLHGGPQLLLATIREKYWPIGGRDLARKVVHKCVKCFRSNPKHATQIMGVLPEHRVQPMPPFYAVGIDFAGPVLIKSRAGRGCKLLKAYIAVFVCFSTKAVYLDLESDLTSSAFIACLRKFVSRRGKPRYVYSDNGRNFVGAHSELKELRHFLQTHETELIEIFKRENIIWKFSKCS